METSGSSLTSLGREKTTVIASFIGSGINGNYRKKTVTGRLTVQSLLL